MPGTVDDFMQRFGGGTMNESEAAQYHDRFVSTQPNDGAFDSNTYHQAAAQYLGKLPDDQFHDAARNAVTQAPPQERAGLLATLIGALGGAGGAGGGGGVASIASMLGLGSTNPNEMSGDDAAKLMNYARKEQPAALQETVAQQPWLVKAMGNPVVMGALTMAAAKLLSSQRSKA